MNLWHGADTRSNSELKVSLYNRASNDIKEDIRKDILRKLDESVHAAAEKVRFCWCCRTRIAALIFKRSRAKSRGTPPTTP